MKRLTTSAIVLVGIMVGLTSSIAQAADRAPTVERTTAAFDLTSATCPNLPVGTAIHGSGQQVSVTRQTTDRSGVLTVENNTVANGTAKDQQQNTYRFHYANRYRISNTAAHPDVFSGTMTDLFQLTGGGPARVRNGFVADLTIQANPASVTDLLTWNILSWNVQRAFGDPLSFEPGPFVAHCDPL